MESTSLLRGRPSCPCICCLVVVYAARRSEARLQRSERCMFAVTSLLIVDPLFARLPPPPPPLPPCCFSQHVIYMDKVIDRENLDTLRTAHLLDTMLALLRVHLKRGARLLASTVGRRWMKTPGPTGVSPHRAGGWNCVPITNLRRRRVYWNALSAGFHSRVVALGSGKDTRMYSSVWMA